MPVDTTQGVHPIKVERQGALGQEYSENSRFVKSDVEFVALHTGSNNNLVAISKGTLRGPSTKKCSHVLVSTLSFS